MKEPYTTELRPRDMAELAIGGIIMAGPFAVTEEVWNLSAEMTLARSLLIAVVTIVVIALIVWSLIYHEVPPADRRHFVRRVAVAYTLALVVSAFMLFAIDRLPLISDPILALKRTILVALPVAFGGTAVDDFMSKR